MRKMFVALVLFLISMSAFADLSKQHNEAVTKTIRELMQKYQIPGAAIAIVDHDKSHVYTFGVANKANNAPVTDKTVFEVGSITKIFTALEFVAITNSPQSLFDPITKYLTVHNYQQLNNNKWLRQITIMKLLTYTAGLPFKLPDGITTREEMQSYFAEWQPTNTIGTEWRYSNLGIGLVGIAMENMSGKEIGELYKRDILEPLNMPHTSFQVAEDSQQYFAQGYNENGKPAAHLSEGLFPAAGDLKSNIKDMSNFLALAVGSGDTSSGLKRAMRETQTPRLKVGDALQGLVWQIHFLGDKELLNEPDVMNLGPIPVEWLPKKQQVFSASKLMDKTGATEGFRSYIAVIPAEHVGVVILLNKYIPNGAIVNAGRKVLFKCHE